VSADAARVDYATNAIDTSPVRRVRRALVLRHGIIGDRPSASICPGRLDHLDTRDPARDPRN
jgi:hypothetical protein